MNNLNDKTKSKKDNINDYSDKNVKSDAASVDKIRDLIFGSQMQDYEKKFSKLEETLNAQLSNLRNDSKKWNDTLEDFIKKEIEFLTTQLQNEKNERINSIQESMKKLADTEKSIQNLFNNFSDQTIKNEKEIRQQLLDQTKVLRKEIQDNHDIIIEKLENSVMELGDEKTDRRSLSNMLIEMAIKLNSDLKVNGLEKIKDE
jgi:hypothetical protein